MSAISEEQLAEWERAYHAATGGEWTHETAPRLSSIGVVRPSFATGQTLDGTHHFVHFRDADNYADAAADAEFIATARTALPSLLAAYRALREENAALRERLADERYEASMAEMKRATLKNYARRNRENRENGR